MQRARLGIKENESLKTTKVSREKKQLNEHGTKKVPRPSGLLSAHGYQQDRLRIQACFITTKSKLEQQNIQHSCFEYSILLGGEKKLGEQVNKKLLYLRK